MIKKYKRFSFLFLFFISCLFTFSVSAMESEITDINRSISLNTDNVNFSKIKFTTGIDGTKEYIGAIFKVSNNNNYNIKTKENIYYYDTNKQLLTSIESTHDLDAYETASYIWGEHIEDILKEHSVDEIKYFKVTISFEKTSEEITLDESNQNNKYNKNNSYLYNDNDYYIDNYNIDIYVNENNTFDITEKIKVNFNKYRHGIIRKIPLKNKITRLDGTTSKNTAVVSNLHISDKYSSSKSNGYLNLKIGDSNHTIIGTKTYTIKYNYNIGKDPLKDKDELYFNIIGNDWDTVIRNVHFTIHMPKDFDESTLGFSAGKFGSSNSESIIYKVNNNVITGYYDSILDEYEGLTVRATFDENYFSSESNMLFLNFRQFIIPIIFIVIAFIIWFIYGKDDKPIETVEFYSPEKLNSLDLAFLYKGNVNENDVISLLIYFANKGYVKVEETKSGFKIIKLKDYKGKNENEKIFFEELFNGKEEVKSHHLKKRFYKTINKIVENTNTKENKEKIYKKKTLFRNIVLVCMIIVVFLLTIVKPIVFSGDIQNVVALFILTLVYGIIIFIFLHNMKNQIDVVTIIVMFLLLGVAIIPFIPLVYSVLTTFDYVDITAMFFGVVSMTTLSLFAYLMPKRTKYGTEILGKIKGFKNYLETTEKDQLESQVSKNPSYFYEILPYAYVLGITDVWINKFEDLAIEKPKWYKTTEDFNYKTFNKFVNSSLLSVATAPILKSNSLDNNYDGGSSFGGGFSGGGFSGGGSSGGGGTSW